MVAVNVNGLLITQGDQRAVTGLFYYQELTRRQLVQVHKLLRDHYKGCPYNAICYLS